MKIDKRKPLNLKIDRKLLKNYDLELIAKDKEGIIRTLWQYKGIKSKNEK